MRLMSRMSRMRLTTRMIQMRLTSLMTQMTEQRYVQKLPVGCHRLRLN
jgi:hypothetical protein